MATADPISETVPPATPPEASLLVLLAPMAPDQLEEQLASLASVSRAFPGNGMLVATPDAFPGEPSPDYQLVSTQSAGGAWTLTAADFVNAYQMAQSHHARAVLILGPDSSSLSPTALHTLASAVLTTGTDLAIPCYDFPPLAGMVNSAILYPLTRALFASGARFPLAIDLGLSMRMAERLATAAQRFTALNQPGALIWPIDEAAAAGFTAREFDVGTRTIPQPSDPDLNAILPLVTGSLFAEVESKAAFWQRARILPAARTPLPSKGSAPDSPIDIAPMLDAFRLAYTNLREIWSLVLPPNSLLALKRLSVTDAATFRMPDNLWARTVYDFLLAYRLRTINRGHLMGALIPLYLAWVASHINITMSGVDSERHIEAVADAFEADKPYLVSRWRWPDRFNP